MIRPAEDQDLHLAVGVFADKEMSQPVLAEIDSRLSSDFFMYLSPDNGSVTWIQCTSAGFPRETSNLPVIFDMPKAAETLGVDLKSISRIYVKYSWYRLEGDGAVYSDTYSTTLPAATEVGANAQDQVSKAEFTNLKQNVVKESGECTLSSIGAFDYYLAYSTKYCIIADRITDGAKIALMDYGEHKTYKIDFSTGPDAARITFCIGLANGNIEESDVLNSESHQFAKNKHYLLEICDEKIFVYDGDAVYASTSSGGGSGGTYRYPLLTAKL